MTDLNLNFIGDIEKVSPEPGDVFVISYRKALSADQVVLLRKAWQSTSLGHYEMMIFDDGLKLSVISKNQTLDEASGD